MFRDLMPRSMNEETSIALAAESKSPIRSTVRVEVPGIEFSHSCAAGSDCERGRRDGRGIRSGGGDTIPAVAFDS